MLISQIKNIANKAKQRDNRQENKSTDFSKKMKKHNICFISLLFSKGLLNSAQQNHLPLNYLIMDWDSAKKHCTERNWQWSLEIINQAQKEMEALETKLKKCEDQQKANRLYNACNY